MAIVRPFKALRPGAGKAAKVASLPYDVMNRAEAKEMVKSNPESFLKVVRSETSLPDEISDYDPQVYEQARENLKQMELEGVLVQDEKPLFYIYRQIMDGRVQTGLVATVSVDAYLSNDIKKHELTLETKELDRINHFDITDANTEPIFLTYRQNSDISKLINDFIKFNKPNTGFISEDNITHYTWAITDEEVITKIQQLFEEVEALYIADGHHRSASAAKVGLKRREQYPEADENAEFNYFMAVIFPDEDLFIMDYNRIVKDLNGLSPEKFLRALESKFTVRKKEDQEPLRPRAKGHFGMYLEENWYELIANSELYQGKDAYDRLDVSILQQNVLAPILGIEDPRTDNRIDFVGGIRGLQALADRVDAGEAVAFAMYPTTMAELLEIADAEMTMPPKSTWFEPKLRSGLFVHKLSD
ncbi:MAG TPA: DUF1015 domain-containing protein [Clostridiaceae bacterium]|nr:DUF1015 domain-containing protein [Clostridiaceae bacterium]